MIKRGGGIKEGVLMGCFRRILIIPIVLVVSLFLAGCQLYKGEETFVPSGDIVVKGGIGKGLATLDSLNERVVLEVNGLTVLDEWHTYEAWLVDKDIDLKISLGTFKVDENGYHILDVDVIKEDILDTDSVMVTLEAVPDTDSGPSDDVVLQGDTGGTADIMSVKLETAGLEAKPPEEIAAIPEEVPAKAPEEEAPESIEEIVEELPEETTTSTTATTTTTIEERGEAVVIVVKETAKVSLATTASDPDADRVTYAYSSPLDANGEWQTSYGDAGEYTVTVTVSDGKLSASKDVLIIVNKKEEPPVIDEFSPTETELKTDENTELEFSAKASDINKDELKYSWKLDEREISTGKTARYAVTYDDAGAHQMKLDVTDGTSAVGREWRITVNNVNRAPVLDTIASVKVKETETVMIEPKATDPDGDTLAYTISDPVGDDGEWKTTYDDAGEYKVIVTVTDGVDSDVEEVKITVENVNRPPVIEGIVNRG